MNIKDYIKLYGYFVKNSIIAQMEFRSNFIMAILIEIVFLMSKGLYIVLVFALDNSINGMSSYQVLMFIGSYTLITGVMDSIYFPNISAIPEYIRKGDLDVYLCKPISSQFLTSFRRFDIGLGIPNVLAGLAMIIISWNYLDIPLSLSTILGYLFFTIIGCILTYPVLYIPVTFSFYIIKTEALTGILWSLWDFNNMPMGIYNRAIRTVGVFVIPIFAITNFAPMFVMGALPGIYFWYCLLGTPILIMISILFWNYSVKRYSSASS